MASSSRSPPQQAQQPAGTYTPAQGASMAAEAEAVNQDHLVSASNYIIGIFEANSIPYALMGGFSLNLRGSARDTYDIDFAVGCDMQRLIAVLKSQDRVLRPLGPVSGVMRIFVRAGGSIDAGLPDLFVVVDLILQGSLGAPDDPQAAAEVITSPPALGSRPYTVLNIAAMMSAKLGAFFARSSQNDFTDIQFLVARYAQEIWSIRAQLNQNHRQAFIDALASSNPPAARLKGAKQILGIA